MADGAIQVTWELLEAKLMRMSRRAVMAWGRRVGAYVRRVAQGSMRRASRSDRRPSRPGEPPRSRLGFRGLVAWGSDQATGETVVGFLRGSRQARDLGRLHEYGGVGKVLQRDGTVRHAIYPPRPTIGPALEKSMPYLARMLAEAWAEQS